MTNKSSSRRIIIRLLRHNISGAQIAAFLLANILGLAIIAIALQFHADTRQLTSPQSDSFVSRDYMIISRHISGLGAMLPSGNTTFTPADIDSLAAQPWAADIATFTPSLFNITARVDMPGSSLSTALFVEGIPDKFIDNIPSGWDFTPGTTQPVPLIVGKDYLTLYNFGFASTRGLPQLSESMISALPLQISLSGNGRQIWLPARIAGFSSRLNTIIAPRQFVQWANETFGDSTSVQSTQPSRIIIELSQPGNPDIERYLSAHSLEAASDKAASGRAAYLLSVVTSVVAIIGLVITLLSFIILLLSIHMLLLKNRPKMRLLMLLGYTPRAMAAPYWVLITILAAISAAAAIAITTSVRTLWLTPITNLGMQPGSFIPAISITVAVAAVITVADAVAIAAFMRKSFPAPHNQN